MNHLRRLVIVCPLVVLVATVLVGRLTGPAAAAPEPKHRVFEIRTYTTEPGKLPAATER